MSVAGGRAGGVIKMCISLLHDARRDEMRGAQKAVMCGTPNNPHLWQANCQHFINKPKSAAVHSNYSLLQLSAFCVLILDFYLHQRCQVLISVMILDSKCNNVYIYNEFREKILNSWSNVTHEIPIDIWAQKVKLLILKMQCLPSVLHLDNEIWN